MCILIYFIIAALFGGALSQYIEDPESCILMGLAWPSTILGWLGVLIGRKIKKIMDTE